jgi:hypothetical protein
VVALWYFRVRCSAEELLIASRFPLVFHAARARRVTCAGTPNIQQGYLVTRPVLPVLNRAHMPAAAVRRVCRYAAMCYTLLHQRDAMRSVFRFRPETMQCTTWAEVAALLWRTDGPPA